ncbi:nucleoporin Nup43 isoform X1 [Columba livia]
MAGPGPGPSPPGRVLARRRTTSLSLRARRRAAANQQARRGSGGSRRAAWAAMEDVCAKFVSQKISKTRWRPLPAAALQPPDLFATGSWDNEVDNRISLWSVGDLGNVGLNGEYQGEPQLLCDIRHNGDVMDMQFLDQERIVVASSTGTVTIFRHHQNNQTLSANQRWEKAHYHVDQDTSCGGAACTGVICNNPEIVTVGEDGRINLFRADQKDAVRSIDNADSSTLHAVTFLRTNEILTVNSIGQLKIWDLRQQRNEPSQIFSLTGDRVPLHCVDRHPNQQHIVATGGQDGMLSIWDIRQGTMPVSLLNAHEAEMWEVHFHPSKPDHLFTCSEDGSLWHWDTSTDVSEKPSFLHQGGRSSTYFSHNAINQSVVSAWLSNDPTKDRMEITNLIPNQTLSVNSLDVLGPCLVYGTDAEAIYVNRQLFA